MRGVRNFDEFIKQNTVRKQSIDKSRAGFLIKESEKSYNNLLEMVKRLELKDDNANLFVKSCYDILMELIRAKMLLKGYNASGPGAHEAEISYMRVLGFLEKDVQFADQIRFFRNGMLYYGTILDKAYAEKVIGFTKRIYSTLKGLIMGKFDLLKKDVEELLLKSPILFDPKHAELTLKWLLKFKPDADEALMISAFAHDIERAVTGITEKDLKDYSKIHEFKKEHSKRSAKIAIEMMKKYEYDEQTIEKVKHLIEAHEEGGDEEQTILMEADSLAYFDYNIPHYFERYGKERTKGKIQFMYKRLPQKAKDLVNQIKFENEEIKDLLREAISEL